MTTKACMSRDRIRYWCRPVLQARTHLFHSIKRPRQIPVDDQSVNWDLFEMLAELGVEIYTPVDFTPSSSTGPWSAGQKRS